MGVSGLFNIDALNLTFTRLVNDYLNFKDSRSTNLVNLARADPSTLELKALPYKDTYFVHLKRVEKPAICICTGICVDDLTQNPHPVGPTFYQRTLNMIPQTGEIHRMVANLCILTGVNMLVGPLTEGSMTDGKIGFSSRPGKWEKSR